MDFLTSLIFLIIVGCIIALVIGIGISLLPFIAVAVLVILLISWFKQKSNSDNTQEDTYYTNTSSSSKNDAIDVEYTERDDDGQ